LSGIKPEDVQQLDSTEHIKELQEVGQAVAKQMKPEHFCSLCEVLSCESLSARTRRAGLLW
jgi:hypothetical protein